MVTGLCTQGLFAAMDTGPACTGLTDVETVGPVALGPNAGFFRSLLENAEEQAAVGQPAVVGPDGAEIPIVILNAEVLGYKTQQGYKRSNEMLKFVRDDIREKFIPRVPCVEAVELTHALIRGRGGVSIPKIGKVHDGGDNGMGYTWSYWEYNVVVPWAILKMLPEKHLRSILGDGAHLCRMTIEPVLNTYDIKRRNMRVKCDRHDPFPANVPVWVWGFHVLMSNGRVWRFHPDYSARKASVLEVMQGQYFPRAPAAGLNKSDGPGTYKHYKNGNYRNRVGNAAFASSAVAEDTNPDQGGTPPTHGGGATAALQILDTDMHTQIRRVHSIAYK